MNKINYNTKIINTIINICCLINNANEFENKIKFEKFQKDKYNDYLLDIEIFCLLTIICLIHIINFDNEEIIKCIFNNIFEKIYEFKKYKESLSNKTFSPHLTIIKCYSLFLNRFCFNYSLKHDCDLLDSFNYFLTIFPEAKDINKFIFVELINYFGFIISQLHSFFIHFGKDMFLYYLNYFDTNYNFIKSDITLMKYLLNQSEIKEQFTIKNILAISNIDSSNNFLLNILNVNIFSDKNESINDLDEKYSKYNNSFLEFLYLILRDNLSMEKIAFSNVSFKFKMKDELFEKLYKNENEKINTLIENEIIHFILGQKNLVKRDDCIEYLKKIFDFDDNYIELIDDILKNKCEKIVSTNGLIEFSLKKEILNLCDIDYIISFKRRKNAIEYLINFQSKNNNLSNINVIEPLNIEKRLMKNL